VKKLIFTLALFPIAALLAGSLAVSHAAPLRVADGDTIELGGQRIRLQGVDAPELHQECRDASGRVWACGRRARSELRRMIGNDAVQCSSHAKDRFGRSVAICRANGRDLGEAMVRSGWALAYPDWASPYGAAQSEARSRKAGLWAGSFQNPRAWRDEHPRDDRQDNRPGIVRYGGDIIPRAAQDWLRERSQAAGQSVMRWVRSFWAGTPDSR
jgi:endonuclease YncB( thermonuclease family)